MSIPISALQRNAAAVIRKVAASGTAEEVTDRGRVVAVISAPGPGSALDRLRRMGAVRDGSPDELARALERIASLPRRAGLSDALTEQRDVHR